MPSAFRPGAAHYLLIFLSVFLILACGDKSPLGPSGQDRDTYLSEALKYFPLNDGYEAWYSLRSTNSETSLAASKSIPENATALSYVPDDSLSFSVLLKIAVVKTIERPDSFFFQLEKKIFESPAGIATIPAVDDNLVLLEDSTYFFLFEGNTLWQVDRLPDDAGGGDLERRMFFLGPSFPLGTIDLSLFDYPGHAVFPEATITCINSRTNEVSFSDGNGAPDGALQINYTAVAAAYQGISRIEETVGIYENYGSSHSWYHLIRKYYLEKLGN